MQIANESSSHFASTAATEVWSPGPSVDGVTPTLEGPTSEDTGRQPVVIVANQNRIGRFVLLRQIGEGGMGSVFAAYDEDLDRKVAIKILRKPEASIQLQRTLHEAKALARVSHPNVVSIYEVGQTKDSVYIAMEYVEGGTLLSWQVKQPRSWPEVLSMYLQAGEGLAAAHQAGIVHRDFKPDKIPSDAESI